MLMCCVLQMPIRNTTEILRKMEPMTLSVNPGEKTLGVMLKTPAIGALRYRGMVNMSADENRSKSLSSIILSFILPVRKVGLKYSVALAAMRLLTAAVCAYGCLSAGLVSGMSVAVLVCAAMVAAGVLGRPAAGVLALLECVQLITGSVGIESGVLLTGLSAILCVAGPGWLSADAWLRSLQSRAIRRNRRRMCRERMASVGL